MTNQWSFTPRRKPRESAAQMLARKQNGETLTDEEDAYVKIYGNIKDIQK